MTGLYLGVEAASNIIERSCALRLICFLLCSLISLILLCACAPDTLNPPEPEVHSWPLLRGHIAAHAWTEPAGTARCCLSQIQASMAVLSSPEILCLLAVVYRVRALFLLGLMPAVSSGADAFC